MADLEELLQSWGRFKTTSKRYYRLTRSHTQKFDHRRLPSAHPSNFASVVFDCQPAIELSFVARPEWPPQLSSDYCRQLEQAVGYGIIEGLFTRHFYPYRGCKLTLTHIEWDDGGSSEVAFYLAAKGAMEKLIAEGAWHLD